MSQFYVTYPSEVEDYRRFLLGLVADLDREAESAKARNDYELIRINRNLIEHKQPYIDELTRIAVTHAQFSVVVLQVKSSPHPTTML